MTSSASPSLSALRSGSRDELIAFADRLLRGAAVWASPNFARITPPGDAGGYGTAVDGLEGFARTFLLAGFRIAGARGEGVDELIRDYSRGIVAGVDPEAEDRWVRLDEHPQAKVEAASLAVILDMTRPWIWDRLDATTQQRVIDYLAPAVGDDTYPRNNWLWFRITVQTFLRSVGGPWSADDIAADLALHESFVRSGGWLSDGDDRGYDHYVGWALHLYPVLWSRMQGAGELGAAERIAGDVAALDRYLQDAVHLVGGDGAPQFEGRSLIYRFAAAAPFWAGVLAGVPSTPAGTLRDTAMGIAAHFEEHGSPDADDLLTMGWFGPWRRLAQNYSGPSSPYWASKGLLGVALPADHPVWSEPAGPLPSAVADDLRVVEAAGWIVAGTASDGIVRVINHGADHASPDAEVGDSPIYARLGYSTVTAPLHDGRAWAEPLEQSVALIDAAGRGTHRAGMTLLAVHTDGETAIAGSRAHAHWIAPDTVQVRHGSGITGDVTFAGHLTTWSIVRGAWEIRIATVQDLEPGAEPNELRVGGWPVAAAVVEGSTTDAAAAASAGGVASTLVALSADGVPDLVRRDGASPLGAQALVPVLRFPVRVGEPVVTAVHLGAAAPASAPQVAVDGEHATVTWPDGARSAHALVPASDS
ncbi:DUF2264 domain-containing protein [Microbacterium bovistercoris]|uniref:DUF2264 domain-containing protein n=1 Tax=Microbacterium bovistercoris TaxID=2293570 RepID=UPI001FEC68F5|nr:DUF2264 domain-containing protein [Microbacterium bovistercoris]